MLLWLLLVRIANQPTIMAVVLFQQGWTLLLHTKTEEFLCALIGVTY